MMITEGLNPDCVSKASNALDVPSLRFGASSSVCIPVITSGVLAHIKPMIKATNV